MRGVVWRFAENGHQIRLTDQDLAAAVARLGKPPPAPYGFVQVPIHQRVNESQLAPGPGVVLGVSKRF